MVCGETIICLGLVGGGPRYEVIHPVTKLPCAVPDGGWRYGTPEKMLEMIEIGKVVFREDHSQPPIRKTYLIEVKVDERDEFDPDVDDNGEDLPIQVAGSYFYRSGLQASNELVNIFGKKIFNNPKDHEVLTKWISYIGVKDSDIIMDFFAGSGTTAHSSMLFSANENKAVKYILVQLPEIINSKDSTSKNAIDLLNKLDRPLKISEITKERIRRAGQKVVADNSDKEGIDKLDIGFRVLKVDSSNMADVHYNPDAVSQAGLFDQVENVKEGRTEEDLLFQVMLDWGVDLTLPIRKETIDGKTVFFVDDNALVACFDNSGKVSETFVKKLAEFEPMRLVFRDGGFASDSAKINVEQVLKQLSPLTDIKSI
ncbi:site-specific DNA-methyltransferase [Psychromonas ingrahamii]|uniref:hypothetical protein n=1 Tax=Psychromonas ingrahamii TaxID=357794 RepID=UPI0000D80D5F|nr:hypothetical protein [Psychromonas ingrahamii]